MPSEPVTVGGEGAPASAAAAYGRRATEYAALFGDMSATERSDRERVAKWAATCQGTLLDAGCGPGQWTDFLRSLARDAEGIDPAAEFVDIARERFPECRFGLGGFDTLADRPASFGGILAWYSTIHLAPVELPGVLATFRRALVAGGGLCLGFFAGDAVAPYAHAVAPATLWPVDEMARLVAEAGFDVDGRYLRRDGRGREHGIVTARATPATTTGVAGPSSPGARPSPCRPRRPRTAGA